MKIDFKSKKWDKEMKRLLDANDFMKNNYYNNIEGVYKRFLQTEPKDYIYLYGCLVNGFEIVSRCYFVDGNMEKVINNTYLSAKSFLSFKEKVENNENTTFTAIKDIMSNYEYTVCKLIAIEEIDLLNENLDDSIMKNLFYGDEKVARELIDKIPEGGDDLVSVYYNDTIFLKNIYNSILERDDKKFHNYIIQRIKKYRKNMVGYSTIIDYTSIALFKIAKKYGINKQIDVVEIPKCFWENIQVDTKIKNVLPID